MSQYFTAKEAGQHFPKPISERAVVHRMKTGIAGVRLGCVFDGRKYLTTQADIDEFIQKSSEKRLPLFPERITIDVEADMLKFKAMKHAYKLRSSNKTVLC